MNSGNSVADYREITFTCHRCSGTGEVEIDGDELMNLLRQDWRKGKIGWKELRQVVIKWRKNGRIIECPECNGAGRWERLV